MIDTVSSYDDMNYRKFTTKSELDTILNTLIGILEGITLDNKINHKELQELNHWCNFYRKYEDRHPFNQLLPLIDSALKDNILTDEEFQDIFWLVNNLRNSTGYYDSVTASLQRLYGIFHGILADNEVTEAEIRSLNEWLSENDDLKGCYPYDEIDSLVIAVLADRQIDQDEKNILKIFFGEFVNTSRSLNTSRVELDELKSKYNINGICAACPEIAVENSTFCFTGSSINASRAQIKSLVEQSGGKFSNGVTKSTDYLIIGADGNPCWVFSCYGRKVEKAIIMRKSGHQITIVHENDFWDEIIPYAQSKEIDCKSYLKKQIKL